MTKKTFRRLAAFFVILCLQMIYGSVRIAPEAGMHVDNTGSPAIKELVKTSRSWDGALLPSYPEGQPEVTILRIVVPAGTRLATHRHPVINAGLLLSGQLTVVTTDGKTLHLKAGDPIVELVNTWHYGINEGKVPAEIVVFYAGVVSAPITVVEPQ
jgi:quercetin dioxygenase-like cupin family protein